MLAPYTAPPSGAGCRPYGLSVTDLLRHNLGPSSAQLTDSVRADLDWDPPTAVLATLAERTGVGHQQLRWMTIAGWMPWLSRVARSHPD